MPQLILYYMPTCPYCQKVLSFIKITSIQLAFKDISANPANREELRKIGGKPQVPCLVIDGKALYESNDIVNWLKVNFKK